MRVLVTGATGYIGGRLVPRLLEQGHAVRVRVRDRRRITGRPWADRVDVAEGDLLDPQTLPAALKDMEAAYYLVHSMGGRGDFAGAGSPGSATFRGSRPTFEACDLSRRSATGNESVGVLAFAQPRGDGRGVARALPVTEFRAGPIIGSGSASFEMLRYLVERLPVMVSPRWVHNRVQPIAIRDILNYLVAALSHEALGVVSVGGPAVSFKQMMQIYAQVRGLRRWIVTVPVLTPTLSARWVGLVTPIPNRLAVPLIEGVIEPLLLPDRRAAECFPEIEPVDYRTAVERALAKTEQLAVETRWSGALGDGGEVELSRVELSDWEGLIREVRTVPAHAPPTAVFDVVKSLGGEKGWLVWESAWWLRGALDRVIGGPGLRRGRRHPTELLPGEAVDFWRVEEVESPALLRLRAEMKVPGRAWLQWQVQRTGKGSRLVQTAFFEPRGLPGVPLLVHAISHAPHHLHRAGQSHRTRSGEAGAT